MTKDYVKKDNTKTIRSVVAKTMYEVSKQISMTRDQTQYQAANGKLTRNSYGTPLKTSVAQINIDDLCKGKENSDVDTNEVTDVKENNFTWNTIVSKYKHFRKSDKKNTNLYHYIALHWKKNKESIPQFF